MENEEMLEQTNETENVETQTTEENVEGIELTDTSEAEEVEEELIAEEKEEVKKTLKDLLRENPEYQEEYNTMLKIRLDREDRKHQKEISKYRDTENVLRTTLNVGEDDDVNQKLREAYEEQGIKLPDVVKPGLSRREIELLARADAEDIIEEGYDAMVEEANRLASKKYENLNERERVVFNTLAEKLTDENNKRELLKLGAKEELLKDENFNRFRKQFNSNVSMKDIYGLYKQTQPKPKVETPGSMRNEKVKQPKIIFTDEDIAKMTDEELDKNWEAIRKYQTSGNH